MRQFQATSTLAATPQTIWPHMSDVVCWPEWMHTFSRITALAGRDLAPARCFNVEQPRLRPTVWTVTWCEPNVGFTWQSRVFGLRMVADHCLEPNAVGTVLQLRFGFDGLFSSIAAVRFGTLVQSYLEQECAAYRRRLDER